MTTVLNGHEPRPEPVADVYALLGITPDASPALAQHLHAERVEQLRERLQQGDPVAREELATLNQAIEILTDPQRRLEYQRRFHHRTSDDAAERRPRLARTRRQHIGVSVLVLGMTAIIALVTWWQFEWLVGVAVAAIGLVAALTIVAWPRRTVENPFAVLGLTSEAKQHHVELAYQLLTQAELQRLGRGAGTRPGRLARVRGGREHVRRLEILDRARVRAKQELVVRYVESSLPPPSSLQRARHTVKAMPGRVALWLGDMVANAPARIRDKIRKRRQTSE